MNETLQTIKARRSVRVYTEQQVSPEDLDLILQAAVCAPSGMNHQDWHFVAIQNASVLTQLNDKVKAAFAKSDNLLWVERGNSDTYCCYYHAPTLIVASGKADSLLTPSDCACALENIFLAARSLGIASCWINQPGQTCDDPEVRTFLTEELGIPADYKVFGCAALGYAPADMPVKERKMKEYVVTVIR